MNRVTGLITLDIEETGPKIVLPTEPSVFDPNKPMWDVNPVKYHAASNDSIRNLSVVVRSLRNAGYKDATSNETGNTVALEFAVVCHTQTFTFNLKS